MPFHAAKDLVYTINGNSISSGGYRISNILNGKSKKKGKQMQAGGDGSSSSEMFKEDSGIPVGLLLLQRLHHYDREHGYDKVADKVADYRNKNKDLHSHSEPNKKLVYASIMTESDHDDDDDRGIELIITPSMLSSGFMSENEYSEDPIEISSNEIDDELYDSLIKSVSGPEYGSIGALTPLRRANTTKKQNFGKHKDIENVYQKKKTRSKRRH